MAKSRLINTRYWSDPFIQGLNIDARYLYLYFLTNEHTSICGIYEISTKTIMFDTDLSKNRLSKAMDSLSEKILYLDGWVCIKNFAKHQQKNPKVKRGIEIELKQVPKRLLDRLSIDYDSLSIDYDRQSHSNSNSNSNSNFKGKKIAHPQKEKFLDFVMLTKAEHKKLVDAFGGRVVGEYLERLNEYIGSKGKKYKSHYFTILSWMRKDGIVKEAQEKSLEDFDPYTVDLSD